MRAVLAAQSFAGNQLVRGAAGRRLEQVLSSSGSDGSLFLLVSDRRVCVADGPGGGGSAARTQVRWLDRAGLAAMDIAYSGQGDQLSIGGSQEAPVYLLGEDRQAQALRLAVDVTAAPQGWAEQRGVRLQDLRLLMALLPPDELSVAGHAMALSQWHLAHQFCGRCGAPTVPAEAGARRQCTAHDSHRQYPRTDPVVIMLVESPDGRSALLGRSKAMRPGMLTALSGFVDQGEAIEEAVRRETREEAGVQLAAVDIVGSQPWPVGRGGSCELMIGCIAKAAGSELTVDLEEMSEVRWASREDVAQAVRESESPDSPYLKPLSSSSPVTSTLGFFVPPPFAIAHHLMRTWVQHGGPWFSSSGEVLPALHQAAAAPAATSRRRLRRRACRLLPPAMAPLWPANTYAAYRPGYPAHVLECIYEFAALPQRELALDVACGTGQVAVSLAETFQQVVAQDSSASQIAAAQQRPNIRYEQAPAEASGMAECSVDLITAAQCMHWFDAPRFYAECRRVLKPTGALAVFSYIPLEIHFPGNQAASEVLQKCLLDSNPFFDPRRQRFVLHLFEGQEPTAEDFGVIESCAIDMPRERSVEQIVGWCQSMSGWAGYEAAHPGAAERLAADLQAALGVDAGTPVPMVWPLTMLLAKQPRPLP
ncbi:Nudix hydrolase chloroplastic [Chlorella sorokiniana]|uniref:NAD(+) diphosphatase n=1 Tax=Chlorella sorokiniana TaxID=3076 RepID=A0A2P6TWJ0_CHLSO|nr:Nudix hydrolase chloroplastic [Chlorella sorokiniana]|eukprot:PRW58426.1 Nudix hydrolase chloroplastic [Chlorella sorokiniana]